MSLNNLSRVQLFLCVMLLAALSPLARASTEIIDFNGISGEEGSQFTSYMEHGFTVSAADTWLVSQGIYGNPPPGIYFIADQITTATIALTDGGALFNFNSVDAYSSVTTIPYTFTGFLNGNQVFTVSGNTELAMGRFLTIMNPDSSYFIDTLDISVTNRVERCCNPMALDNINVTSQSVPEPATLSLLGLGAAAIGTYRRKRAGGG